MISIANKFVRGMRRSTKTVVTDAFAMGGISGVGVSVLVFKQPTVKNLAIGAALIAAACLIHVIGESRASGS